MILNILPTRMNLPCFFLLLPLSAGLAPFLPSPPEAIVVSRYWPQDVPCLTGGGRRFASEAEALSSISAGMLSLGFLLLSTLLLPGKEYSG